jgi:hypothetical protein
MAGEKDGDPLFSGELAEQAADLLDAGRVEAIGGLVQDE